MVKWHYVLLIVIASLFCFCCGRHHMSAAPRRSIESVLKDHVDQWMAVEGVVGVYQGEQNGNVCIKIMVVQKSKRLENQLPKEEEGYPVVIEETGVIKPL